ncbi:MAG: BON domain-containing protein [Betaproteobacteria bacterium]|nr:MAG: BON domain-containing protein [Betaproteobacteria bacterium]
MQLKSARAEASAKGNVAVAGRQGGPGEYVEDSLISAKVKAAVLAEASLKSADINVETSKGVVQLSGFVRSKADVARAAEITRSVKDVKSVKNDIVVKGQP